MSDAPRPQAASSSPARAAWARPRWPRPWPCSPRQRGKRVLICEVDAKGDVAGFYEAPPTGFNEKEILPGLFAMTMDTEASLREYLKLQLRIPVVGPHRPAGQGVRLRGHRRARGPGDPHGGQALLRGPRAQLRPGGGGRPGLGPHRRASWPPPRPSTTWSRWASSAPRPTGCSRSSRTPDHRAGGRVHARGDAGQRDHRAGRAGQDRDHRRSCPAVVVNRVLPELFGRQEEEVFDALGSTGPPRPTGRAGRGATPVRCSTPPAWP